MHTFNWTEPVLHPGAARTAVWEEEEGTRICCTTAHTAWRGDASFPLSHAYMYMYIHVRIMYVHMYVTESVKIQHFESFSIVSTYIAFFSKMIWQ